MGIFGFSWADGGAFVGGALGGALLGPPGAMLGSAAGSFAGATWGDDKGTGAALEEAVVAGIGAAGGAWATDLAGVLLRDGIASAATRTLSAGAARRVDRVASRVLLPWNGYGGGPVAAFGGAIGGYEVSAQARSPVQIATTDIGNGGCPVQMANLRMPAELTGPVGEMYRDLPGYLCEVWRSFGTGPRKAPPAPELPAELPGADAGIAEYAAKARRLNTMTAGFAELDARAVELIASGAREISDDGRAAVGSLVDTVNIRAAQTPQSGISAQNHALDLLDDAFGRGRQILAQAVAASDRVAGRVADLTGELAALRTEFDAYRKEGADRKEREDRPRSVLPPAPPVPPERPFAPVPVVPPTVLCAAPVPSSAVAAPGGTAAGSSPVPPAPPQVGASVSVPQPLEPQARSGTGDILTATGAATPRTTPWTRQTATDRPIDSQSAECDVRKADSNAPIRAIPGWIVPSFVPAAASGPVGPSGSAPVAPWRALWTGTPVSPPVAVGVLCGSAWGIPAAAGRARIAGGTERELGTVAPGDRPTDANAFSFNGLGEDRSS